MTTKYSGFEPQVKFTKKQVRIDQITGVYAKRQGRVGGTSTTMIEELMRSIESVGLGECIQVEALEYDPAHPEDAVYRLRDGNHRLGAIERLREQGKWSGGDFVTVKVYEHDPNAAELDWQSWQVDQNAHSKKLCTPNKDGDLAFLLGNLLAAGKLGADAYDAAQEDVWDSKHKVIDEALYDYMDNCPTPKFKGVTKKRKDSIRDLVYKNASQNPSPRVIQYDPKLKAMRLALAEKFGISSSTKNGEMDIGTGQVVRVTDNNQFHPNLLQMADEAMSDPTRKNILVFHVKNTDPKVVRQLRQRIEKTVNEKNRKYADPTMGYRLWSGKPVFPELWFLGQINKEGQYAFIQCRSVRTQNKDIIDSHRAYERTEELQEARRIADIISMIEKQETPNVG